MRFSSAGTLLHDRLSFLIKRVIRSHRLTFSRSDSLLLTGSFEQLNKWFSSSVSRYKYLIQYWFIQESVFNTFINLFQNVQISDSWMNHLLSLIFLVNQYRWFTRPERFWFLVQWIVELLIITNLTCKEKDVTVQSNLYINSSDWFYKMA